jgi:hypothetical protein
MKSLPCLLLAFVVTGSVAADDTAAIRHERVAARRKGTAVICHRGSSEFAHENTLEAYRATFELGADGNEIDIRVTRDGVIVCFHDDMLDHILDTFGDAADYDWAELQTFPFRKPGQFGEFCRIPTLEEVLLLHRRYAGLIHLDIKRPGLDAAIGQMLERLDMWDHVISIHGQNAPELAKDARFRSLPYKGGLYLDRSEVDPQAIVAMLDNPGGGVLVDDPRGVLVHLKRKLQRPSSKPVTETRHAAPSSSPLAKQSEAELLALLNDATDWDAIPQTEPDRTAKAQSIRRRAEAAEEIRRRKLLTPEIEAALVRRVRQRSLHPEWMHHGIDGAAALRALGELHSAQFIDLARECLWRDDPAVAAVLNPEFKVPRSWTDFRTKLIVFDLVPLFPGEAAKQLCRDYLALSDDEARQLGTLQFEAAGRALLALHPSTPVAAELFNHRRSDVRGRTLLSCLERIDEPWAHSTLESEAPYALKFVKYAD